MKLYNTLTRKLETLKPLKDGHISLYTCGPTVYQYYHIGNLRNAVFNDTLKRALLSAPYKVDHISNITDVGHLTSDADSGDDKLQSQANQEGKTVREVAEFYTDAFHKDMKRLNILTPKKYVKATDAIESQKQMVQTLLDKGFAYQAEQAIYFDVTKLKDYGKLSGQKLADKETAVREEVVVDPQKHHPWDFALWFFTVGHFADHAMHWPSPWGEGFPGWHLECSAIIEQELGTTIDIHTGGVDHIGTHHTNEIAQSEAAHDGKPLANVWVHNQFLLVDGQKMSKSKGNYIRLQDVVERGFDPMALRLLYLQAHYRTQQNFTWEALTAAQNYFNNLSAWADLTHQNFEASKSFDKYLEKIVAELQDDLKTPQALSLLSSLLQETENKGQKPSKGQLARIDEAFGLGLSDSPDISEGQKDLIAKREEARDQKDFKTSDKIRQELAHGGIEVEDTTKGPRWRRATSPQT